MDRIGPLMIIEGPNNSSKVPNSRSLYIDCSDKVLIDSGCDPEALLEIDKQDGIELIINTHYHRDHIFNNYLFPDATKIINPIEFETATSLEGVLRVDGILQEWGQDDVEMFKKSAPDEWVKSLESVSGTYEYEREYSFGGVKVHFIHSPGHTSGLACPYFPELGVAFVVDYDMTSFGPWYNGATGDIDKFITSGKRLLELDADTYITGHQKGIFPKQEFKQAMDKFLGIIDQRDELITKYVHQGLTFEELTSIGIFYPQRLLTSNRLKGWERSGIRKHLKRLELSVPGLFFH